MERLRPFITTALILSASLALCLALLAAGAASTQPVVKIGLVAPFDGRFRAVGYEAIYAARLAIREINARGGLNGYRLELVALDDRGEPDRAIEAARQLALDPQVIAILGHLRPDSSEAAMKVYCEAGLPAIIVESAGPACAGAFILGSAPRDHWPDDQPVFVSNVPDPTTLPAAREFVTKYNAIPIDGTRAGPIALQTYEAMYLVFDAIARAGRIDRAEIAARLASSHFRALIGEYAFDQAGDLIGNQSYWYAYDTTGRPQLITP
jgi:ABC-type branched-subunit amino acid transport system substrate-binding protein